MKAAIRKLLRLAPRFGAGSALLAVMVAMAIVAPAQTYNLLASFDGTNGSTPNLSPLVQGPDGDLYGTTVVGGDWGLGTVFKVTPTGTLTKLYSFCTKTNCTDGSKPLGGLVLGRDGNFYGTTEVGGTSNAGTIYKITPAGSLTTLYSFNGTYGSTPFAGLIQASDGNFYGTTEGYTVFKMTPKGKVTLLHTFNGSDGSVPRAALIQASDGNLYGTTFGGGAYGDYGTIFMVTLKGKFTSLYSFDGPHGYGPWAPLIQASDGSFYGTTYDGGANNNGTIFKMTAQMKSTWIYSFQWGVSGANPEAGLAQGTDGNFYGTTSLGSPSTIFDITPDGTLTTLYNFGSQGDGNIPTASPLQATNGTFYGTTAGGGAYGYGTVFSLSMGSGAFVSLQPNSGVPQQTVQILGQGFNSTTSVMFGSGSAKFTVISDGYMTAIVPAEGTSGYVTVTTGSGTLNSNKPFTLIPVIKTFAPTSGKVGTQVTITGGGFHGTTKVAFGGVKATSVSVDSGSQITAVVPTGAKKGTISVTTAGGTAISKGKFTVTN